MTTAPVPRVFAFMESRQLGMAWLLAIILGAIVISSNTAVTAPRVILPAAIMIAYGIFVFNRWSALFTSASEAYKHTIISQLADSMYFMGFVWTLWALIDSFVIHQINASDAIFRSFGYALVTTATGMFIRLIILQFKYTATEQSLGAQESVEELLLKFGVSIELTNKVLNEWQSNLEGANSQIQAANATLSQSIEHVRDDLDKTITSSTKAYIAMLGITSASLTRQLESIGNELKVTLHNGVLEGLKDFGQEVARNMDLVREASVGVVTTLKRTNTGLGKSITDLTTKIDATTLDIGTAAKALAEGTQHASEALVGVTKNLETTATRLDSTVEQTKTAVTAATQIMIASLTGLSENIKREVILGLNEISVVPRVSVTMDESVLNGLLAPLQGELQSINTRASEIEKKLETEIASAKTVQDISKHVDDAMKETIAVISGHLEPLKAELMRPVWGRIFGR